MKAVLTGLGITTSGPVGAALISGDAQFFCSSDKPALGGTLPAVRDVLDRAKKDLSRLDYLAVCVGPGSFTGLRIGVAFAKSVAQAAGIPLHGVSAYDVAEYDAAATYPSAAIVEGKRDYFYVRIARGAAESPRFLRGTSEELQDALAGVRAFRLPDVPAGERALRVAHVGARAHASGDAGDWRTLTIDYGQQPNAELNWDLRTRAKRSGAEKSSNQTGT